MNLKILRRLAIVLVVIAVLTGLLALDLANQGLAWRIFWNLTGEEIPLAQIRGMVEWTGNFIRPQPHTDPMTPINHTDVNPYGINTFLQQEVELAKREQQVQMIADAGFTMIRQQFPWADIEIDGRGDFIDRRNDLDGDGMKDEISAWDKYDNIVDLAEQYGIEIQARLDNPPRWSRANPDIGDFAPPDDFQDFVNYTVAVAERYKGRIRYYQIWNEPNANGEWGNQPVSPEGYTDLLCRTYTALKAVDPEIVVISGPLSPTVSLTDRNLNDFIFLQRMYDAGAGACFDVMSAQGYGFFSSPTDRRLRPMTLTYARHIYIRDIMVANGDSHKPIWISEAAWNSQPEDPAIIGYGAYGIVTEEQAARYMPLAYQRAQEEWPWIGNISYWFFKRADDSERNQAFYYFRMVEPDFTPLPVYNAMKNYITSQTPVLYAGVHQAKSWAVELANPDPIQSSGTAHFNQYIKTNEVVFYAHGTDIVVRWSGGDPPPSVEINDEASIYWIPHTFAYDGWYSSEVASSLLPQMTKVKLVGFQGSDFNIDSITVLDRAFENIYPLAAGAVIAVGMLLWAIISGVWARREMSHQANTVGARRAVPLQKFLTAPLPLRVFALGICILLLAAFVRFHNLGAQSLWNDEGNSYVQATRSFADIAANAARDIHPPGYYWLLAIWRALTGASEFALRSLSVFASILTVAFTYAIGKRIFSPLAGLSAALFVALNTFSIYYAQEARMYALLALWSAASMWALAGFLKAWRAPLRWALALALFNAAGLWTQYAYPFVMLVQGVLFVGWFIGNIRAHRPTGISVGHRAPLQIRTRLLIYYVAANLLTIALYLPWLPTALERVTSWPNTGEPTPFNAALGMILGWFTFGITYSVSDASWVAVGLFLLIFGLRARRKTWQWVILPFAWTALPVAVFLALGLFRESNLKFLLPSQIGFALLMGRGVWALWALDIPARPTLAQNAPKLAAVVGVLGIFANLGAGLTPLYHDFQRADYRGIASIISANLQPNDAVILDAPNQEEVFRYYYRGAAPIYPLPPGLGGNDDETRELVRQVIADHRRIFVLFWGETERDPNQVVESTLDNEAYEARSDWYGDVRLVRYVTPIEPAIVRESSVRFGESITLERYALSADTVQPGDVLQLRLTWRTDAPLETRYKVFAQLLDSDGVLVAQRDSEPGGGLALTTTWETGESITDNHALLLPDNLSPANYTLIIGLYNIDNPQERLQVGETDYLTLGEISVSKNAD